LAAVDDAGRDPHWLRQPAQRRRHEAAGQRRQLPERGRLAHGHQRHAGDDGVQLEERRVLPHAGRPGADADAGRGGRAREGDPRVRPARLLGGARHVPRRRRRVHRPVARRRFQERSRRRPQAGGTNLGTGQGGRHSGQVRRTGGRGERAKQADQAGGGGVVRPHDIAARCQREVWIFSAQHARHRAGAVRAAQGADLSANRLALPTGGLRRHGEADARVAWPSALRQPRQRRAQVRLGPRRQQEGVQQRQDFRSLRHHPHAQAGTRHAQGTGAENLRPRDQAVHRRVLSVGRIPGHDPHHPRGGRAVQDRRFTDATKPRKTMATWCRWRPASR